MSLQMVEGTYVLCKIQIFQNSGLADENHLIQEIVLVFGNYCNVVTNFSQRQNAVGSECIVSYGEIIAFGELRIFAVISQHNYDVYINGNKNQ